MSVYSKNKLNKSRENESWSKIFKFVKPNSRILDIGCSSGQLGAALRKEKKAYVVGLDLDAADVKLAKQSLDEAHVFDIEKDSLEEFGTFDYVILADVIEHLVDPVAALKKIKKVLKPSGELLFSIPNMANATIRLELLKGRFEYKDWGLLDRTHLHFYDTQEVNRVFSGAGYVVMETDCTIRVIPDSILEKELKPLNIPVTTELTNLLGSPESATYQFIGRAKPNAKPVEFVPATNSSLDSITREIDQVINTLQAKHNEEIATLNGRLTKEIEHGAELEEKLNIILNSKSWKVLEKAYSVKHMFRNLK